MASANNSLYTVVLLFVALLGAAMLISGENQVGETHYSQSSFPMLGFYAESDTDAVLACELSIGGNSVYSNDSIANGTQIEARSNSSLSDGQYLWEMRCSDSGGSAIAESGILVIDTVQPSVSINAACSNNALSINASADDANPYYIEANATDASGILVMSASGNSSVFIEISPVSAGAYTITAMALDMAGNAGYAVFEATAECANASAQNESVETATENETINETVSPPEENITEENQTIISNVSEGNESAELENATEMNQTINETVPEPPKNKTREEGYGIMGVGGPVLNFVSPTPDDGSIVHSNNITVNVTSDENLSSCYFNINATGLWTNVKHLGVNGGIFDYNASIGAGGYASSNALNVKTVMAGAFDTCYLLSNGNSTCVGINNYGEANNYTGGDAIAAVAGDTEHTCYLLSNGNSACYGENSYGESTSYTGGDAIAVATGYHHTCYILSNGSSACYGTSNCNGNSPCFGSNGESTNYTGGDAIAVAAGQFHTCYLLSNGNSTCYGWNDRGRATNYTGGNAIALSAGVAHTCYLLSNGSSICYGYNGYGQTTNYTGGNAIAVSAGYDHTCYLLSNGNSTCYGNNNCKGYAQCSGQSTNYTGGNAIALSAGYEHTCYLLSNGNSTCFGSNIYNQSTNYTGGDIKIPFALARNMNVQNADADTWAGVSLNLSEGSYLYNANCLNVTGASNTTGNRTVTVELYISISNVSSRVLSGETSANTVWITDKLSNSTVDYGTTAALGSATPNATLSASHSVTLTGLTPQMLYYYNVTSCTATGTCNTSGPYNFTTDLTPPSVAFVPPTPDNGSIVHSTSFTVNISSSENLSSCSLAPIMTYNSLPMAIGERQSCYVLTNGNAVCYGSDSMGELANYTGGDAIAAAGGQQFTCYLLSNGNSACYGDNRWDQSTNYTGGDAIALSANYDHTCYLISNGNSVCYGSYDGEGGAAGQTVNYTGGNAVGLACGHLHTCYLLNNRTSVCYGSNSEGQSANYTGGNAIAVSAGRYYTCYLLSNGNSACYGNNGYGQATNYTGGNAIAVSAGENQACYLLSNGNSACYGRNDQGPGEATNYTGGNAVAVVAGWYHTCYLLSNGNSVCYGRNSSGQSANYMGGDIRTQFQGALPFIFNMQITINNADADTSANATFSGIPERDYLFYANCTDSHGNSNITANRTVAVEYQLPISGVSSTVIAGETSAYIIWATDKPSNSTVNYGTTTALGSTTFNSTLAALHNKTLTGLTPQTLYYYNVTSCTATGTCNTSGPYNFTTDLTPPSLDFIAPTPANGAMLHARNLTVNVSSSKNLTSCSIVINITNQLWTNIMHLNLFGGRFDYNASIGANNYSSFNMINRNPIATGWDHACYLLNSGNSTCFGDNSYNQSINYRGGDAIAVSAGDSSTCYLLSNGNSTCYGDNGYNQSTNYTGGNAIAVAAGYYHTCYLLSNGNSVCYGFNTSNQIRPYAGGNAIAIAAGYYHTCYLLSNGNSVCYGLNDVRQATNYTGGNAIALAAADTHACYLLSNGNSTCYGDNACNGNSPCSGESTNYTGGNAIAVSTKYAQTCYLLSNGNSVCYGLNGDGQSTNYTGGDAVSVSVGAYFTCYLRSNGNSTCYGNNNWGQRTNYTGGDIRIPFVFASNVSISNADASTFAVLSFSLPDGAYSYSMNCTDWAGNSNTTRNRSVVMELSLSIYGVSSSVLPGETSALLLWNTDKSSNSSVNYGTTTALGTVSSDGTRSTLHGITLAGLTPQMLYYYNVTSCTATGTCNTSGPYNFTTDLTPPSLAFVAPTPANGSTVYSNSVTLNVSSNENLSSCSLADLGTFGLWNNVRALGVYGGTFDYNASTGVNNYSSFNMLNRKTVAAGGRQTCYILGNGNSTCYGDNSYGPGQSTNYTGGNAIAVSSTNYHTCYLLNNGNSTCYGYNSYGQTTSYTGGNAVAVFASSYHTCYILSNGNSTCYGANNYGMATNYSGGNAIAVAAGKYFTCYLLSNGNSTCYGDDTCFGYTPCTGQSTNYTGGDAVGITASPWHTCYLLSNGNSTCYGYNVSGSINSYTGGNAIAVSAGGYTEYPITSKFHTCYLLSNGNSVCYGYNSSGDTNSYTGGNAIAVSAGQYQTCYLLTNGSSVCYGENGYGQSPNYTGGNIKIPFYSANLSLAINNAGADTSVTTSPSGLPEGSHSYYMNCTDMLGNPNVSANRMFYIEYMLPISNVTSTVLAGYTSASVRWITGKTSNSTVEYGTTDALGTAASNGTLSASPSVTISGLTPHETYYYNVTSCTALGLCNTSGPYQFVMNTSPMISFVSPTPNSNTYVTRSNIAINISIDDTNFANVTAYLYNSTGLLYSNTSADQHYFIDYTGIPDGLYYFNATAFNTAGVQNSTETRNVTIDTVYPTVQFLFPTPGNGDTMLSGNMTINVSSSENLSSCRLSMNVSGMWNTNVQTASAAMYHTCYVLSNGNSTCYGDTSCNGNTPCIGSQGQSTSYVGGNAIAVAVSLGNTCYILSNGNSQCYGSNEYNESTSYTGGNAIALSSGYYHTCYVLSNGNSTCYGFNNSGQTTAYSGGDAIAVSAAGYNTCYLRSNGNSTCYGANTSGSTNPYTNGNAVAVAAGIDNTCYLLSNGNSVCYGSNNSGKSIYYTGGNAIAVSIGYAHTCYLLSNGNSICYGDNSYGMATAYTGGDAVALSATDGHTCYILSNGNSTCHGRNDYNQSANYSGGNVKLQFSSGRYMALNNADASTWASVDLYNLQDGIYPYSVNCSDIAGNSNTTETRNISVELLLKISNISAYTEPGETSEQITWTTDKASNSTLSYGNTTDLGTGLSNGTSSISHSIVITGLTPQTTYYYNITSCTPRGTCSISGPYSFLTNVLPALDFISPTLGNGTTVHYKDITVNISSSENLTSCTLSTNATFALWENISHLGIYGGRFDYNASAGVNNYSSPNMNNRKTIASGDFHTCYVLSNGSSACFGNNSYGQATNYTGTNAISVAAGSKHTCYLLSNGNSTCYGDNTYGKAYAYTGGNAIAVAAGDKHTCYLLSNGNSSCWGATSCIVIMGNPVCSGYFNQSTSYTGGDAIAIAAGRNFTCYLLSNGNSACFGDNGYNQSVNYTGGDAIAVSAGVYHTCYLRSNGNSACYGDNSCNGSGSSICSGQATNYTKGDAIAVSAGGWHTCYLKPSGNSICYGTDGSAYASVGYIAAPGCRCYIGLYSSGCTCTAPPRATVGGDNRTANYTGGDAIAVSTGLYHTCYLLTNGNSTCYGAYNYTMSLGLYGSSYSSTPVPNYTNGNLKFPFRDVSSMSLGIANAGAGTTADIPLYNISEGSFSYSVNCTDESGGTNRTETRTFTVELSLLLYNVSARVLEGDTTALITWNSDKNSNSTLGYGSTTALGTAAYNSTSSVSHSIFIEGLVPNQLYHFNISSCTPSGTCNSSGNFTFIADHTPPSLAFSAPTPDNNTLTRINNMTMLINSSEDLSSCQLSMVTGGLWTNIMHLNIYGGRFDYNASIGVNNYSSFNMLNRKTIAAGSSHTCYLLSNGNSTCYGDNGYNQSSNYTRGDAISVAAGYDYTCYLRSNGNSTCYGSNGNGQSINYTGGDAISVSGGGYTTCYLLSNGNSTCYGDNGYNQATNYTGGNAIEVAAGSQHACYLLSNGSSKCYGRNDNNQSISYAGGNAIAVSAGNYYTCYLLSNGNSTCYGDYISGFFTYLIMPNYTGGDAIAVAAGSNQVCYLLANGTSRCYGLNGAGEATNYNGGDAIAVSGGNARTCYLLTSGNSTCYGYNYSGSIRPYTRGDIRIPFQASDAPLGISNAGNETQAAVISYRVADGNYTYSVNCSDLAGNTNATEQRSIVIDTTNPAIAFARPTDNNTIFYTRTNIIENASASDANFANLTIYLYNSTGLVNYSVSTSGRAFANYTNLSDGVYYINATAYDTAGNSNTTERRNINITYDRTAPRLFFISVTDNSSVTKSVKYINANVSAIDNQSGLANVSLRLYGSGGLITSTSSNESPLSGTFSRLLNGVYRINATATDVNGNLNRTETRNITINRNLTAYIVLPSPGGLYSTKTTTLNYIIGGFIAPTSCWYTLDSGTSRTAVQCSNASTSIAFDSEGEHCVYLHANGTGVYDNDTSCFNISTSRVSAAGGAILDTMEISSSVSCVRHSVGEITVLVKDSAGAAVSGASVSILGTFGTTDSAGKAKLRMADGEYTVVAQASGHYSTSASVEVSCESFHTLDVLPSVSCGKTAAEGATVSTSVIYDDAPASGAGVAFTGTSESGASVSRSEQTKKDGKAKFNAVENGAYSVSSSFQSLDSLADFDVSCHYALPTVSNETGEETGGEQPGTGPAGNASGNGTGPTNKTEPTPTATANATTGLTIEDIVGGTANATRDIVGGMIIFVTSSKTAPIAVAILVVAAVLGYALAFKPGLLPFMRKKEK